MNFNSQISKPICEVLGEIPVSPVLKKRVRQRLFSLVNNIDGYIPSKDNNLDELSCNCQGKKIAGLYYGLNNHKIDKNVPSAKVNQNKANESETNDVKVNILEEKLQSKYNKNDLNQTKITSDPLVSKFCDLEDKYSNNDMADINDLILSFKQYINELFETVATLNSKVISLEDELYSVNEKHERNFELLRSMITLQNAEKQKEEKEKKKLENKISVQNSKKDVIKRQIQDKLYFLREEIELLRLQNHELLLVRKAFKNERKNMKHNKKSASKEIDSTIRQFEFESSNSTGNNRNNNVQQNLNVISKNDEESFVREYENYISAQLKEYKKGVSMLRRVAEYACSINDISFHKFYFIFIFILTTSILSHAYLNLL